MDRSRLLEILACPRCGGPRLDRGAGGLHCRDCREWYEVIGSTYDFFPYWEFYGPRRLQWLAWRAAEQTRAAAGLSSTVAAGMAELGGDMGRALVVGSGIATDPRAHVARAAGVIGLDARLAPPHARWPLVRGTAELLPFADKVFDAIVGHAGSIQFVQRALAEIRRCLASGGRAYLAVATHEEASDAPVWPRQTDEKSRLLRIESLGRRLGPINRFLKRHLWAALAYHPDDLEAAGILPSTPRHSAASFLEAASRAGLSCAREIGLDGSERLFELVQG